MEIYWYFPWPHDRASGLASGTVRPGDHLTVHTLDSDLAPPLVERPTSHTVIADLPSPAAVRERSPRWAADRTKMLIERNRRRSTQVRSRRYDVAHIQLLNLHVDSWALSRLGRRLSLVSSVHDVTPHHRRVPRRLERELLLRTYSAAGSLIVYHSSLRDHLVESFDVDEGRVHVIPHPVRCFDPGPPPDERGPTVLFFGAFRRNKGIEVLLEAIEHLRGTDAVFRIAGRGSAELEDMVRSAADRLPHLSADIRFIPNDERRRLYQSADAVVLPYTSFSSQSGVLADAYSFGVPLVVTDVGALGATVREDETGWVVPAGDAQALAHRLASVLDDHRGRTAIVKRMSDLARDRSEASTGRAFRSVYDGALGA